MGLPRKIESHEDLKEEQVELHEFYDHIIRMLVKMIFDPEPWLLPRPRRISPH